MRWAVRGNLFVAIEGTSLPMLERTDQRHLPERPALHRREYVTGSDIAHLIRRYFWTLAGSLLLAIAVTTAYLVTATPIYVAKSQLLIEPRLPQPLRESGNEVSLSLDSSQVESQIAVLRSSEIAAMVIDALDLTQDPEFQARPKPRFMTLFGLLPSTAQPALTADEQRRIAIEKLQNGLDIRRAGISYAIEITFGSEGREKSALIANAVAEAYLRDILQTRARAARAGNEWLEDRVADLRNQMNAAARRVQAFKASHDYRIGRKIDRDAAAADAARQNDNATSEPTTLEELESTAQTYRRIYENFYQAFTEAVQRESYPVSNTRIISRATIPATKSRPKIGLTLAFGALLGLLAGAAVAYVRHGLDRTVRSAQQIREETGVECLGLVPTIGTRPARSLADKGRLWLAGLLSRNRVQTELSVLREVIDAPYLPFSDGVKRVKTALNLSAKTYQLRSIGVTSALPREGKTTISGNLAAAFAAMEGRTLLIDADVRSASLSRTLAPGASIGLLQVIGDATPLDDAVIDIKPMGIHFLPVATATDAAAPRDLLSSSEFGRLLEIAVASYDTIIVDLPPLHPVADAIAISAALDGVVIVAEWEKTEMPMIADAVHSLRSFRANVAGVVITKVGLRAADPVPTRSYDYMQRSY